MHVHGLEQPPSIYVHSVRSRRWLNGAAGNEREQVDVAPWQEQVPRPRGDANAAPTWVLLTERGIVDGGLLLEARQMGELVPPSSLIPDGHSCSTQMTNYLGGYGYARSGLKHSILWDRREMARHRTQSHCGNRQGDQRHRSSMLSRQVLKILDCHRCTRQTMSRAVSSTGVLH